MSDSPILRSDESEKGKASDHAQRLRRLWAYGVSLGVAVAVLLPVVGDPRDDDFPLSAYPMFSGRQSPEASIAHVVGYTASGDPVVLPPAAVANDEVVQAFETVRQAIGQGPASTLALCVRAAAWASDNRSEVTSVVVVTDEYNAVRYFDGDKEPLSSKVHGECEVQR